LNAHTTSNAFVYLNTAAQAGFSICLSTKRSPQILLTDSAIHW